MGASLQRVVDLQQLRESCAACSVRELCLPAAVGRGDMQRIEALVRPLRPLAASEAVFHEGAPHRALFVVRGGSLKSIRVGAQGVEQILGFHYPGEIVGFDGFVDARHQSSALALQTSRVCRLPIARLEEACAEVPGLQQQLMHLMSREMHDDHEHIEIMGRPQAVSRLALFLASLAQRYQRLGLNPRHLDLSMSRADLANYLGLVLETVSRLFGRLQEMEIIEVRRRKVTILDPDRLRRLGEE